MQFGVLGYVTDYSIAVVDLARAVEEAGFESLWFPGHTNIPVSRKTPWPGGAEIPKEYSHQIDQFVGLGAAAAVTSRLKLGTGICLVAQRDPIVLAKEVASLDHLSGGRFLFGIGGGWNYEEMEGHGTNPRLRWKILRERVLAMKQIWTQDEAEFHGRFVNFDRTWSWPKPLQKPHPPIVVGGNGPRTLQRVVDYGDEWMPIVSRPGPTVEERMGELQRLATEAGRGRIPVTAFFARPEPADVERYQAAGVSRCIFGLPSAGPEDVLPLLSRFSEVARAFA